MPAPKPRIAATDALVGLWTLTLTAFVIAALYFGRDLLIPLALSALLTFLLSPLVTRLERWLGRIVAVLLVVALIFSATGGADTITDTLVTPWGDFTIPIYLDAAAGLAADSFSGI